MNGISRRTLLKNSALVACAAAVPALGQTAAASANPQGANPQIADLKAAFAVSHAFTVDMANAMPEDKYHFKPVPLDEVRSFGQQMVHIADGVSRLYQHFIEKKDLGAPSEAAKEQFASKADVIAKLDAAYKYVEDAVAKLDDAALDRPTKFFGGKEVPARQVLRTILDHSTHHRGQTVVYLRLNGTKPATYRA